MTMDAGIAAVTPQPARLRVAIVAPSMRILGGQAVQADRLVRAWQNDPEVHAWLVPINPLPPAWVRRAAGIKYARTIVTELTYWPLLLRELRRADVVHVFSASYFSFLLAPLPAVIAARLLGRPVVLNYRSGEAPDHLRRSAIARATLARVDRNLVPSRFLKDVFASFGLAADVVPNIVDVERFRFRLRDPLAPRLVSTRNFEGLYNVACTLKAFRLVQDEYPGASLTLVGSGSLYAGLGELARQLRLANVTFAGRVPPEDIWRFYADADIYVQTPDIDNMPASLLEAYSSGTPAVSTDAGGVPAILTDEVDGLLAPAGDHAAVARQVLRLLREPGLAVRLATTARQRCEQYTWPQVRNQWLAVYRSVAAAADRQPAIETARITAMKPTPIKASEGQRLPASDDNRELFSPSGPSSVASRPSSVASSATSDVFAGFTPDPASGARDDAKATISIPGRSRLAKLRSMDSHEIRVRAGMLVRRGVRRAAAAAGLTGWRRRALARRLAAGDSSIAPVVARLSAGDWMGAHRELTRHFQGRTPRFVLDPAARGAITAAIRSRYPSALEDAEHRADAIVAGRYDLLGYRGLRFDHDPKRPLAADAPLQADVDWKLDPVHGRRAPDAWWTQVPYLDAASGDHKIIWELNRHQHWLALGRAYWLLGREQYRTRFVFELESWLRENPPLVGINWASMLELALRSLSWIWALHLFLDDPFDLSKAEHDVPWLVDLLLGLDRQLRHVEENLSHYFSPNTHLTGEALALYVAGRVLPELTASTRWETTGRRILIEQAARQVAPDGGHLERSTHYHRYTLDFYLLALAVARATGDAAAERAFEPLVVRLARFAWAMADANGCLPRIGDDDAGALMPIAGGDADDVRGSLSIAASLLPSQVPVEEYTEDSLWVTARNVPDDRDAIHDRPRPSAAGTTAATAADWDRSIAFPTTGYYVSRSRSGDHLVFDAGAHGFLNGGHAHADALSLTLSLRWHPLLIDAGTGTYTMDPALRDRFRSTALHNTLVLDDRQQSVPDGPFHWARTADGRAIRWASNPRFDFVEASHDGFAPATHRRAVFSARGDLWLVADHVLDDRAAHSAAVHWHLDPAWHVRVEPAGIEAIHPDGLRAVLACTTKRLELFRGDRDSGLGWCSPAYGRIVECATVRFSQSGEAPFSIATLVVPGESRLPTIEPIPVQGARAGSYAYAVRIVRPQSVEIAFFAVPAEGRRERSGGSRRTWHVAGFETDARFAWVRLGAAGEVRDAALVDGTLLQRVSADPFRLQTEHEVRDVAVAFGPAGLLDIFGSAALPTLAVDAPAAVVKSVRVNEASVSFRRDGAALVVPSSQRAPRPAPRPAESPVTAR